jgi:hypothetical protein
MNIIHYSEFANMIDSQDFLDSVKRAIEGTGTDLDSPFVMIPSTGEVFKVIADKKPKKNFWYKYWKRNKEVK